MTKPRWASRAHAKPLVIVFIVGCHLAALAAPLTFTWSGLVALLLLYYLSMALGVTMGYHRLFAHRSYSAPRWFRVLLGTLGCAALQGGPIRWVLTHRLHHRFADTSDDPHSPRVHFFWAHVGWNFYWNPGALGLAGHRRTARELFRDRDMRRLERAFLAINAALACALLAVGFCLGGWFGAVSLFVWGFALRAVVVWHGTWFVNSASHTWGSRRFPTPDESRNLWWVAVLTFGEGWHNNHHARPGCAAHGRRWYEIDVTYYTIYVLSFLKIISKVRRPESSRRLPRSHQQSVDATNHVAS